MNRTLFQTNENIKCFGGFFKKKNDFYLNEVEISKFSFTLWLFRSTCNESSLNVFHSH